MSKKHVVNDLSRRETAACFSDRPGSVEMMAFGVDADPSEPPASQVRVSPGYTVNCYFRGAGWLIDGTGRRRIGPGSVVLRVPGVAQEVVHDAAPRYAKAYISLSEAKGAALIALGLIDPAQACWRCDDLDRALAVHGRIMGECRRGPRPRGIGLWRRVVEWLEAVSPATPLDDALAHAAARLAADVSGSLDLHRLAVDCGLPYNTFRRRFRERFEHAPAAWRLHERMRHAGALLADRRVGEVAEQLGYATPFAFSAQFRRSTGQSPRSWQRRLRS